MDIQKRRFKAILILLLAYTFSYGQTWNTEVVYNDSLETLHVTVLPDYSSERQYIISFSQNILGENQISDLKVRKNVKGEWLDEKVKSRFKIDKSISSFHYTIDLNKSTNIPTKAYTEFKEIRLANWDEILFECDTAIDLSVNFIRKGREYNLGTKSMVDWKLNPSTISPLNTFLELNNVNIYTNLPAENLSDLLAKTLKNFTYFYDDVSLYVLFGNDSSKTGGAFYQNTAVVYIDALSSDAQSPYVIEQVVLHELFHGVSPYKIRPEVEANLMDKNWLAEATPEYLALKFLLKNNLITENQFLETIESKLRLSQRFNGLSLSEMSFEVYKNPSYYQAFYSRGTVALLLLDLKLYKVSDGLLTILDLVSGNFPELSEEKQTAIATLLSEMEQDLVYNENAFPMNKYLVDYGLLYEKRVVLPTNGNSETAEVRKENISSNKMANLEQKSRWQGFIAN